MVLLRNNQICVIDVGSSPTFPTSRKANYHKEVNMKQSSYTAIVKCIKIGAPALFEELITELNADVEAANFLQKVNNAGRHAEAAKAAKAEVPTTPAEEVPTTPAEEVPTTPAEEVPTTEIDQDKKGE